MNPKNPRESNSSTLSVYPLQESKGGFAFTSDRDITYQLVFESNANVFPKYPFGENCVTISIIPIKGYTRAKGYAHQADPKVELTVNDLLKRLFDANPLLVINYSCDLADELERHRSIIFGRWYRNHLKPMGIKRVKHQNPSERVYAAALYHENNPYKEEIEAVFSDIFKGK